MDRDQTMMRLAIAQAQAALPLGEIPVGAVVATPERVIAQAFNLRETLEDPTAHAERLAITLAGRALGTWRLETCTIYVTLEPCPMCAGAIVLARIPRLIYGALDPKAGACESLFQITNDPRLNHRAQVRGGVLAGECSQLLTDFFHRKRRQTQRAKIPPEGCLSG